MDFLESIKGLEDFFEDDKTINEIKDIVAEIKKYDVYDIITRISGLNLMSQNQNKSILLDGLIAYILYNQEEFYNSNYKMSSGKFKRLMDQLSNTNLAMAIDPNENAFVQNIMFMDNHMVYNGIDFTPAYNLQMLIDILFNYKNDFPKEYLDKVGKLITMVLEISDELVYKTNIEFSDVISDEGRQVIIPDGNTIEKYASYVSFEVERIQSLLDGHADLLDNAMVSFGTYDLGSIDNRPFYSRPFIKNSKEGTIIILNVSLLPTFTLFKALDIANEFEIKDKIINRYNEYIWRNCKKTLQSLGHHKIKESELDIKLENRNYYKEMIATAYNNQLMLVVFVCDDAHNYTENTMHAPYPDRRHSMIVEERMDYYKKKIKKTKINEDNLYFMIIVSGMGRGINLVFNKNPSIYEPLKLNPFELHCISVNERETYNFFPRYIQAKDRINMPMGSNISELNVLSIYESNGYSFYINDDFNPNETMLFIAPGDSIDYVNKAIKKQNMVLIESYIDGWKNKVELTDEIRNIYMEYERLETKRSTQCVLFSNCVIWITSDEIVEELDINIYFSIMDSLSFWLAECKTIIEKMNFLDNLYHFNVSLHGDKKTYYYAPTEDIELTEIIKIKGKGRHYNLIWSPKAFGQMSCKTNDKEKRLCQMVLETLNKNTYEPYDYEKELNDIFNNPMKKKFFSLNADETPYLKPMVSRNNRMIHSEDEDHLLDIIGRHILATEKWKYGIIPDTDRIKVTNKIVGLLYEMLQHEIEQLSPYNLIEVIYYDLEEVLYKLMLAGKRYAYDLACYPEKEEEYMQDYNGLNRTSMALRFMIEYVAAKPPKGKNIVGIGKYEYILAICSSIIDWAYKNDLFYYNVFNTPVEILRSNRIGMRQNEFINMYQYGDKYRRRQLFYSSSSDFRKKHSINKTDYSDELNEAFISDYGYTFDQFCKIIIEIINYGNKKGNVEIFCENKDILIEYLLKSDIEVTLEIISKVIQDISLTERKDFLKLPSKFRKEDVYPWRFNRAYSFIRRPVIIRDNEVIWGNRQLYHMLLYVNDLIYNGKISTKDNKMATLIGKISNDRGRIFNQSIVDILLDMKVFRVEPNVKKINKCLIADENRNTLGDIDVLIIDEKMHCIYVAEVKDFKFSRNPYEIQLEYQKMFVDDEEKCYATKHNNRVVWVKKHLEDLKQQYGLQNGLWKVKGLFIVSEQLISNHVYRQNIEVISKAELSIERIRFIK